MKEFLDSYVDLIITQREWSWALVAGLYFMIVLTIRNWFLRPLTRRSRELDRKHYSEIKSRYLSKCALGWFLFLGATAIIGFVWYQGVQFPLSHYHLLMIGIAAALSILCILLHLVVFGIACLSAVKKAEESQKIL